MSSDEIMLQSQLSCRLMDISLYAANIGDDTVFMNEWFQKVQKLNIFENRRTEKNDIAGRKFRINIV